MYRKLLLGIGVILAIIFSFNICFANNETPDVINGIRNVVGGAENAVEDATKDITDASKNATSQMENAGNDITNAITDNNYIATRTSTDSTLMGMGSTAWTWLILGVAAIAIVALVWFYSVQLNGSNHDRND